MSTERKPGFNTLAIHAGAQPDPATGARVTPIYQTTAFVFDDVDHAAALFNLETFGNIYTRITNPTQAVLEERVAALEGGTAALAVASGHAAQMLVFHTLLEPGDEFIAARQLYGGSINQFTHSFKKCGWTVRFADTTDAESFRAALTPKVKAIFVESIANPGGIITDIAAISAIAKEAGVPLIVDNTLATPYLMRPIEHGADIIVHSLTKFLGGHGNSLGGAIVDCGTFDWLKSGRYPTLSAPCPSYHGITLAETFGNFAFAIAARVLALRDLGPAISPFNAFLILTGIETLPLRMQRHCDNALKVAEWLIAPGQSGLGELCRAAGQQISRACQALLPEGRRCRVHVWAEGRLRRRRQARQQREAVQPSCQYRRHAQPDHSSRLDHAPPARRRCARSSWRRARCRQALNRARRRGRSDCRSRSGARCGLRLKRDLADEPQVVQSPDEECDGSGLMGEPELDRHGEEQRPNPERRLQ